MIDAGLAVVLATDFNPGSSPTPSMPMVLSLACTQMKMSPAEVSARHDQCGLQLESRRQDRFSRSRQAREFCDLRLRGLPRDPVRFRFSRSTPSTSAASAFPRKFADRVARRNLNFMKVEVENKPESVSTLSIELPPEEVAKEWDAIANNFARFGIPGYRPGKAPRRVIEAKFRKEIQDELTRKLVSKSYRDAIEQKQLRVVSLTNVEDVEFGTTIIVSRHCRNSAGI